MISNTDSLNYYPRWKPTGCQGRPRPPVPGESEHAYCPFFQYTFDSDICCAPADSVEQKSEFVSGRHIISVVPESLRQLWKRQWFEGEVDGASEAEER